jgi:hypothetical protein
MNSVVFSMTSNVVFLQLLSFEIHTEKHAGCGVQKRSSRAPDDHAERISGSRQNANAFRIRTCAKYTHNSLGIRTYKKGLGRNH